MINLNGKNYKLYYLDTCALSLMVKDRNGFGSNLLNLVLADGIMAVSAYSLWELKSAPNIYKDVIDVITVLPTVLLKSEDALIHEEYQKLNKKEVNIDPVAHVLLKQANREIGVDIVALLDKHITYEKKEVFVNSIKNTFNILGSKPSNIYDRKSLSSKTTMETSVKLIAYQLASASLMTELQMYVNIEEEFPIIEFPSLIAISYLLHYKNLQIERKGAESDVPDILMASLYPYVDTVVTERNQCSLIKQIQKRHNFFNDLKVISINQVQNENYES